MTNSDVIEEWHYTIAADKLREFLRATGNPDEPGRDTIPPTFLVTAAAGFIPRLLSDILKLDQKRTVHGEQTYEHFTPIRVGEELMCSARIADDREVAGRDGRQKRIVTVIIDYRRSADDVLACRETQTIIEIGNGS